MPQTRKRKIQKNYTIGYIHTTTRTHFGNKSATSSAPLQIDHQDLHIFLTSFKMQLTSMDYQLSKTQLIAFEESLSRIKPPKRRVLKIIKDSIKA